MHDFLRKQERLIGLVSGDVPLLSNLDTAGNIALIPQHHQNMTAKKARELAVELMQRFQMVGAASRRANSLSAQELFCVKLLRASVLGSNIVVIDRPFRMLPGLQDDRFLLHSFAQIEDMIAEVYIFDYKSQQGRYGDHQDAEG